MNAQNITRDGLQSITSSKDTTQYKPIYIGNTRKLSMDDNKNMDSHANKKVFIIGGKNSHAKIPRLQFYYLLFEKQSELF